MYLFVFIYLCGFWYPPKIYLLHKYCLKQELLTPLRPCPDLPFFMCFNTVVSNVQGVAYMLYNRIIYA